MYKMYVYSGISLKLAYIYLDFLRYFFISRCSLLRKVLYLSSELLLDGQLNRPVADGDCYFVQYVMIFNICHVKILIIYKK